MAKPVMITRIRVKCEIPAFRWMDLMIKEVFESFSFTACHGETSARNKCSLVFGWSEAWLRYPSSCPLICCPIPVWQRDSSIHRKISVAYPFPATSSGLLISCTTLEIPVESHLRTLNGAPSRFIVPKSTALPGDNGYHFPQNISGWLSNIWMYWFQGFGCPFATVGSLSSLRLSMIACWRHSPDFQTKLDFAKRVFS